MRLLKITLISLLMLGPTLETRAETLSSDQTKYLFLLAQSWSTAKNFHSGTCQLDWDAQLLEIIPEVLTQNDADGFNEQLAGLFSGLGQNVTTDQQQIQTPAWVRQPVDMSWLQDAAINNSNRAWLESVIGNFQPRSNCHVGLGNVGQPRFAQDDGYHRVSNPDAPMRLLGLFRYWNIINVYFPYKNLIDEPWHEVLMEFIPQVYAAEGGLAYQEIMRDFTAHIQDTHAFFYSPYFNALFNQSYLPFVLKTVEGKLVIFKHNDSRLLGAEVLTINDRDVSELISEYSSSVAASNPSTRTRELDTRLNKGVGKARLLISNNGEEQTLNTSYQLSSQSSLFDNTDAYYSMDQQACSIGYVDMGLLTRAEVPLMMAAFNNKDALVFDLRNYPNSTLWTLVNYLFDEPIQIATFAIPEILSPGQFKIREITIGSFNSNPPYAGRVLILMNEETQSQAEYTIMGLEQHPDAVKIGSQTAAADGDVTEVKLPGNISTWFTGLGVYYPDRTPTQRVGIVPDLFIRPSIDGVSRGEDEVLKAALDCDQILDTDWPAPVEPKAGLYWDPEKSGKGMDIHAANGNHVVYVYDFRADGSPVWYQGFSETRSGRLHLDAGSIFEYEYDYDNRSIESQVPEFSMSMDFKRGAFEIPCAVSSPELQTSPAQLIWQTTDGLEMRCLEKMRFSNDPAAINFTGLWYGGSNDDGWGLSVSQEGDVMVVVVYFYDGLGRATWAIGSGVREGNNPLTMGLLKVTGFCVTCQAQDVEFEELGTLTLSLTDITGNLAGENWVSLDLASESPWNREKMPVFLLTAPIE